MAEAARALFSPTAYGSIKINVRMPHILVVGYFLTNCPDPNTNPKRPSQGLTDPIFLLFCFVCFVENVKLSNYNLCDFVCNFQKQ